MKECGTCNLGALSTIECLVWGCWVRSGWVEELTYTSSVASGLVSRIWAGSDVMPPLRERDRAKTVWWSLHGVSRVLSRWNTVIMVSPRLCHFTLMRTACILKTSYRVKLWIRVIVSLKCHRYGPSDPAIVKASKRKKEESHTNTWFLNLGIHQTFAVSAS